MTDPTALQNFSACVCLQEVLMVGRHSVQKHASGLFKEKKR